MPGKTIGTHNGSFHCDEALACYLLKRLPAFQDAEVIRTRDPAILDKCDVIVDVGGEYDPSRHRYDHHQRSFDGTMNSLAGKPWKTRLSSAGLIYLHFGRDVITAIVGPIDTTTLETLYDKMYASFVEEIDAIDNGVNQYDGEAKYHINSTIGSRIGKLNPAWNEESIHPDSRFPLAMSLVGEEFSSTLNYYFHSWLPARSIVEEAVRSRFEVDPSGEIIVLQKFCPWKSHLYELEKTLAPDGSINVKYALFADSNGSWRICCASVTESSFQNRLSLPEQWWGLRDDQLSEKTQIPGCIFVHATGFIGGHQTKEGALQLAKIAIHNRPQ